MAEDISDWILFADGSLCAPRMESGELIEKDGCVVLPVSWAYKGDKGCLAERYVRESMEQASKVMVSA